MKLWRNIWDICTDERGWFSLGDDPETPESKIRVVYSKAAEEIRKALCEAANTLFEGNHPMTFTVCSSAGGETITKELSGFQSHALTEHVGEYVVGAGRSTFGQVIVMRMSGLFAYTYCHHGHWVHLLFESGREVSPIVYCILGMKMLKDIESRVTYRQKQVEQTAS